MKKSQRIGLSAVLGLLFYAIGIYVFYLMSVMWPAIPKMLWQTPISTTFVNLIRASMMILFVSFGVGSLITGTRFFGVTFMLIRNKY